jgi:hypothetical protein
LRRVLIISPNFAPVNAADMHRVRMSLPHFKGLGWIPEVVYVKTKYVEGFIDPLLSDTIPSEITLHEIRALPTWITRKIGLGSLSLRSFLFYFIKVNYLLRRNHYDLIFFSTTMFHVGVLGAYWKWRFNIPFVIDLQDPWRNDFYLVKSMSERPPKFWISYKLLKWTESLSIPNCDGIISVSIGYLDVVKERYSKIHSIPMKVIPFGVSLIDFELIEKKRVESYPFILREPNVKNVVYVGAITSAFIPVIETFFRELIKFKELMRNYHFYFLGTSYSVVEAKSLVGEMSKKLGIAEFVTEHTKRLPYFQTLATLRKADLLFIPGSIDIDYNASKVYNAILSETPIFSIFNNRSDVKRVIEQSGAGVVVGFDSLTELPEQIFNSLYDFFLLSKLSKADYNIPLDIFAENRTKSIVDLFNLVLERNTGCEKE